MQVSRKSIATIVWFSLFLLLGYVAFTFAHLDQLTSFADDGGNYMIMAQYFSPYSDVSPLIEKAYTNERYPPFFPLVLALTGGANNFFLAHQLIVVMFITASLLYAIWATRVLGTHWLGLLASLIYISSPNVWPMLLRILSEELYLALTLGVFLVAERARRSGGYWLVIIALLLMAVLLTRTIGITLIVAWGMYLLMERSKDTSPVFLRIFSVVSPVIVTAVWHSSRQANEEHLYNTELTWLIDRIADSPHPGLEFLNYLFSQSMAMLDNWLGALMLIWQPGINSRTVVAMLLALIVAVGWFTRLRKNCLDAWYSLFYVGLIFIWPFPGQYFRFILPVLPLFIVYAIQTAQVFAGKYPKKLSPAIPFMTGLVFLGLSIPATFLVYQRSQFPSYHGQDISSNPEFYQEADIHLARNKAIQHLLLKRDMELIKARTPPDATIMWFTPGYLNLLADREGVVFPNVAGRSAMLATIADNPPDYIYISRLHPRRTSENGLAMLAWVGNAGVVEWSTLVPGTNKVFSIMLRVDDS